MDENTLSTHMQQKVWSPLGEAARYLREANNLIGQPIANQWGAAGGLSLAVAQLQAANPNNALVRQIARELEQLRIKSFATAKRLRMGRDEMRGLFGLPERTPTPPVSGGEGARLNENVTKGSPEEWSERGERYDNRRQADPMNSAAVNPEAPVSHEDRIADARANAVPCENCGKGFAPELIEIVTVNGVEFKICSECVKTNSGMKVAA